MAGANQTALPNVCNCDGSLATAYYNTNTDCELPPVWVEHKDLKGDLNWTNNADKTENTPRGKGVCFKSYVRNKADLEVSFDIGCSGKYEGNCVLFEMAECGSAAPRDWLFLDNCILDTNATGVRGCFSVFNLGANNPGSGASTKSVTMAPASACEGCACSVRAVRVDVAGEVIDIGAQLQRAGVARTAAALSAAQIESKLNRVISLQGAMGLTLSKVVYPEIDDVIAIMQLTGKDLAQLSDFVAEDPTFVNMRTAKSVLGGYFEANRSDFYDYLGVVIADCKAQQGLE